MPPEDSCVYTAGKTEMAERLMQKPGAVQKPAPAGFAGKTPGKPGE